LVLLLWWPSWISDWHKKLELCRGSTSDQWQLIHKCLIYQRRKQKTTPTNDKMTATVPTFLQTKQLVASP
jgi:Mlc titration factor MtfA (ptsG expression regulator)